MSVDTPILNQGGNEADRIKNTTTKDFLRDGAIELGGRLPV